MSTTPQSPRPVPSVPRADGEAIDWSNVAVETAVMLRLQQAPPVSSARTTARARRRQEQTTG
jgi:hypothetical protein